MTELIVVLNSLAPDDWSQDNANSFEDFIRRLHGSFQTSNALVILNLDPSQSQALVTNPTSLPTLDVESALEAPTGCQDLLANMITDPKTNATMAHLISLSSKL